MSLFKALADWSGAMLGKVQAETRFDQAKALFDAKDYLAAFPLMKEAAEMGSPHATAHLGIMCMKGLGTPCDWEKAAKLFEMTIAVENYQGAYFSLGMLQSSLGLLHGIGGYGLKRDLGKAEQYLQKAIDEGDDQAGELLKLVRTKKGVFGQKEKAKPEIRW